MTAGSVAAELQAMVRDEGLRNAGRRLRLTELLDGAPVRITGPDLRAKLASVMGQLPVIRRIQARDHEFVLYLLNLEGNNSTWDERVADLKKALKKNPQHPKSYERAVGDWSTALATWLSSSSLPKHTEDAEQASYPWRLEIYSLFVDVPIARRGPQSAWEFRRIARRSPNHGIPFWRRTLRAEDWATPTAVTYTGPGRHSTSGDERHLAQRVDFDPPASGADFAIAYTYEVGAHPEDQPYGYWRQAIGTSEASVSMTATFQSEPSAVYWTESLFRDVPALMPDALVRLTPRRADRTGLSFSGSATRRECTVGLLWLWDSELNEHYNA